MRWATEPGPAYDVIPTSGTAPAGVTTLFSPACWVTSWSFLNTDPANPATVLVLAGAQPAATVLARVAVPAAGSSNLVYGLPGLPADAGLYLSIDGGPVDYALILGVPR